MVPLHLLAQFSPKNIVFITPLYFGIAHVHHLYEFRLTHPEVPVLPAVLRSVVQFTYTSLFGFFAAFVYLRTGSVYTAITAHMFCNWMGLPRFWGRVGVEAGTPISAPSAGKRRDANEYGGTATPTRRDLSTVWTVIYYSLLIAGSYGFYFYLFALTTSSHTLADFAKAEAK
jgi:prenyl protein peptidase